MTEEGGNVNPALGIEADRMGFRCGPDLSKLLDGFRPGLDAGTYTVGDLYHPLHDMQPLDCGCGPMCTRCGFTEDVEGA